MIARLQNDSGCRSRSERGIVLMEIMLAVFIFAIAMVALSECLRNCIDTGALIDSEERARLALSNRMAQVQAGETVVNVDKTEELKGMFQGITIRQHREQLKESNEKKELLAGLWNVELTAEWMAKGEKKESRINFYMYAPQ